MYRSDPPQPRRARSRAWATIACWAAIVGALGLLGSGIAGRLAPTSLFVPGTPSARAHHMLEREFGNSVPVTVLLQGPPAQIDRQGRRLVAAFRDLRRVQVMSPWDSAETRKLLRPRPDAALVVANFMRPQSEAMTKVVPAANRITEATIRPPLRAHVGGVAAVAVAIQDEALSATHDAELLVMPFLIIVLLLVFRSPVAAAIPLLMGAATVAAGRGVLLGATWVIPVNSIAVAIASMMGLALGVDYALLMVSRFRQERDAGVDEEEAIRVSSATAGRTIVFAGGTLALAMLTAAFVAPGDLLASVAAGVMVSALLSVLLAISLMPALLRVMAPHLERWRLPSPGRGGRVLDAAGALIARPWIAIPLILAPMLALAAPANSLVMGPPDPRQLPPSNETRQGFEALRKAIGPGWVAPMVVVATARDGVIAEPKRLRAISRWQDRIARDPDVAAVIGPASLERAQGPLRRVRREYEAAPRRLAAAQHGIARLREGLKRAGKGARELRRGFGAAADGAARISAKTGEAAAGARRLEGGLAEAQKGARRLSSGLDRALAGANRLVRGQRRLSRGAARLARGIRALDDSLRGPLRQMREIAAQLRSWSAWIRALRAPTVAIAERLDAALRDLDRIAAERDDPRYADLRAALREAAALLSGGGEAGDGAAPPPPELSRSLLEVIAGLQEQMARGVGSLAALPRELERLGRGVRRLRRGANAVARGARASERGTRRLRAALRRLAEGGDREREGLGSLQDGAGRLSGGLDRIGSGAERLADGLRGGGARVARLQRGLARPDGPLRRYAMTLHGYRQDLAALRARSPGAIDSGYLVLTALDGAIPPMRDRIAQLVNIDSGGESTRMMIVPRAGPSTEPTIRLSHRLQDELPALARASGTKVAIGEGAQSLVDYTEASEVRVPWLAGALSTVAILMLIMVVRSLLLPIVAVILNLLTIAAAFGAIQLLFGVDFLIGPHYVDAVSAAGILAIMFVLSIDYEVFLLTRMRETWVESGDHRLAIEEGLRHTAGVITGAATIMSAVFLAFATAPIASLQQFGAGLTVAVILDATVIRLVLLPAIMRALGPRAWWLPRWLDRRLPNLDHGGSRPAAAPAAEVPAAAAGPPSPPPPPPSPVEQLGAVAHAEHRRLLDLLAELERAGELRDAPRVAWLVAELRRLAELHFRYEQRALFPQLVGVLGPEYVETLYAEQDSVVAALARIEAMAGPGEIHEADAAETRRLARAARASIVGCDALAEVVERQPPQVAEHVLATRERVLAASRSANGSARHAAAGGAPPAPTATA